MFNNKALKGFFIVESGVLSTREFLDFILEDDGVTTDAPLTILVRLADQASKDLAFSAATVGELRDITLHMQSELDLFRAVVAVSVMPSKWVAYEEIGEDFAVLAAFDDDTWGRWSSKDSGILDYVISEERIAEMLASDAPLWWQRDFLREILSAYGQAGER
ncbi:hypothetical protein [Lysobacter antibioticus]|nr:hypothetical protein [Lysobacter antibioticus]